MANKRFVPNLKPFEVSILGRLDNRSSLLKMRGNFKDNSITFLRMMVAMEIISQKELKEITKKFNKDDDGFGIM